MSIRPRLPAGKGVTTLVAAGALLLGACVAPAALAAPAGKAGRAFAFDGVDDYVEVPDSARWNLGSASLTIDFWIWFDTIRGGTTIDQPAAMLVGHDEGPFPRNKWDVAFGGNTLAFHVNTAASESRFLAKTPFAPALHRWYHVAITRQGDLFTIYVDGKQGGSERDARSIPDPKAPLTIGQAESVGYGKPFILHGRIDELAIARSALTAAQVRALWTAGAAGRCVR